MKPIIRLTRDPAARRPSVLRPSVRRLIMCGLAACGLAAAPLPALAEDPSFLNFGVGMYDMNRQVDEAIEFRVEYRSDRKIWVLKPFAGAMGTTDSAIYGYGGLLMDVFFGRRIVVTPSLAAGLYSDGNGRDLGHAVEFRSAIEIAYRFDDRSRLGIVFYHLSNAHLGSNNPGTEVLGLSYSIPLGAGY